MLVKVLDENRVKILMEDQDIDYYDLPFEKLNYDDPVSKAFLYELIQKTYDQTGVNFLDCRLMIEVVPGVSRTYYILLTRIRHEGGEKVEFDKADCTEMEMYIFKLEKGSEVLKFFKGLRQHPPSKSDLYFYNGVYYVTLAFPPHFTAESEFQNYLQHLEEFGERCRYRYTNESILREWGERLLGPDAYCVLQN